MESPHSPQVPSLLDLSSVAEDRRAGLWARTATSVFPGLSVTEMPAAPVGQIRSLAMGEGSLWWILSAPVMVRYAPAGGADDPNSSISLMMQLEGAMTVGQNRRACVLNAGDMCLIDERSPFHLQGHVCGEIAFLRMPRRAVLSRHPDLEHRTANLLERGDAGVSLLRETLIRTMQTASDLRSEQRGAVLSAMVQLLGAAMAPLLSRRDDVSWRVSSALAFIEMNLGDGELTADRVARAQSISRRRLDQVLQGSIGMSVTGRIWNRRLEQAAADLIDPRRQSQTVSQIAFAAGFEDAAHFSRAFKGCFGHTPRDWRRLGLAKAH